MSTNGITYQYVPAESTQSAQKSPEAELFDRGREVFGKSAGGLVVKIKKYRQGNIALARALIEIASTKANPREYIGRVLAGQAAPMPGEEPDVVREARRDGLYVERLAADRWKVGTWVYDSHGCEVGF